MGSGSNVPLPSGTSPVPPAEILSRRPTRTKRRWADQAAGVCSPGQPPPARSSQPALLLLRPPTRPEQLPPAAFASGWPTLPRTTGSRAAQLAAVLSHHRRSPMARQHRRFARSMAWCKGGPDCFLVIFLGAFVQNFRPLCYF
jgi:hypothetical protein